MVDTYTKSVLTIIATALVVLAANNVTHTALAQIGFARVQVCDEQNCARLVPIQQSAQGRTVITWSLPVAPAR
jgi:type IV secretory pathway VirB3-like protein